MRHARPALLTGLIAAALFAALPLSACTTRVVSAGVPQDDTVTVAGTGAALSKPDRADITFTASAQTSDAKSAMNQVAVTATKMLKAVKAAGVAENDLQTTGVTLNPQYRYASGKPVLTGYQASVQTRARVTDLTKIADVIKAGTDAGASNVSGPAFSLSDDNPTKFTALDLAVKDAKAKAASLAAASGRTLGPVVSVTEGGRPSAAYLPNYTSDLLHGGYAAAAVPVQPGQLQDTANVSVVFALQ